MEEIFEFRILERNARKSLPDSFGDRVGSSVRRVKVKRDDIWFQRICDLGNLFIEVEKDLFITAWRVDRFYTASEMSEASFFRLQTDAIFEPSGEECGTKYDDGSGCSRCRSMQKQIGPLTLKENSIPKNTVIARTIADEWIFHESLINAIDKNNLTGILVERISSIQKGRKRLECNSPWYQLQLVGSKIPFDSSIKIGAYPFPTIYDRDYHCDLCSWAGLNLISSAIIKRDVVESIKTDICFSEQLFGLRSGLLRQVPSIIVSKRLATILNNSECRKLRLEPILIA